MADTSREGFFRRFGEAFKDWQKQERGRDQLALSRAVSAPPSAVNGWVQGKALPSGEYMLKLPVALGVRAEWLLNGVKPMRPVPGGTESFVGGAREVIRRMGETMWELIREYGFESTERYEIELWGEAPISFELRRPPGQPELTAREMREVMCILWDEAPPGFGRLANPTPIDAPLTEEGGIHEEAVAYSLDALDEASDAALEEDVHKSQATG